MMVKLNQIIKVKAVLGNVFCNVCFNNFDSIVHDLWKIILIYEDKATMTASCINCEKTHINISFNLFRIGGIIIKKIVKV